MVGVAQEGPLDCAAIAAEKQTLVPPKTSPLAPLATVKILLAATKRKWNFKGRRVNALSFISCDFWLEFFFFCLM